MITFVEAKSIIMEKELSEKESLLIIQQMIYKAKSNIGQNSIFYLIWGWAVLVAALGEYLLVQLNYELHWLVWPVFMIAAAVISLFMGRKISQHHKYVTFVDHSMRYIWIGFGAFLFLIFLMSPLIGWKGCYFLIIGLYGLGTFISGGILRFRPLIFGGIASLVISATSVLAQAYIQGEQDILLLLSLSIVVSYLIPGYMLRAKKNADAA